MSMDTAIKLQNAGKATAGCGCTLFLVIFFGMITVISILGVIGVLK